MSLIRPLTSDFEEYVRDESRTAGEADTISFPTSEDEVRQTLRELHGDGTVHADGTPGGAVPVTVQGGRTGLAAGAVPHGGHVMNLSRMNAFLGLRRDENGIYYLRVQPGVVLANLRKALANKSIPTAGWDKASLEALDELYTGSEQFFPTDPTETSACIGGMVACNASGARSYHYGPARPHVSAVRVALADGDMLALRRGETHATGRTLRLTTEGGRELTLDLPTYQMPHTKNASGYFAADDMDALDLFVGSDGTLGVITEIELALMPNPPVVWGVSCFFESEAAALDFTVAVRPRLSNAAAIEYFDAGALDILRSQRANNAAFASLPDVPARYAVCIYVELDCPDDATALQHSTSWETPCARWVPARMTPGWPAPTSTASASASFATPCPRASTCSSTGAVAPTPSSPSWEATCPCPTSTSTTWWRSTAARWPRAAWRARRGATSAPTTCT